MITKIDVDNDWNLRIGPVSQLLTPSLSTCGLCKTTWAFVKGHSTPYENDRACFPLCEQCWSDLETPAARLPYYRELWEDWQRESPPEPETWDKIVEAVNRGG